MIGLSVGMAAASKIMPQMNSMFNGMNTQPQESTPALKTDTWDCECGQKGNTGNFCLNCGRPKPVKAQGWDCPKCGQKNIIGNFCPNCGTPKPAVPSTWDCPDCGQKGITGNFCPNCGRKRG